MEGEVIKPVRRRRLRLFRCVCRHCDDAEDILRGLAARHGADLEVVRVERAGAPELAGWRTPEVYLDDRRLSHFQLAERRWRQALEEDVRAVDGSVSGELVCLSCYLEHDARGPGHRECAAACVAAGSPMGLLCPDGRLFTVLESPQRRAVYQALRMSMAEEVRLIGEVYSRGGLQAVVVRDVGRA